MLSNQSMKTIKKNSYYKLTNKEFDRQFQKSDLFNIDDEELLSSDVGFDVDKKVLTLPRKHIEGEKILKLEDIYFNADFNWFVLETERARYFLEMYSKVKIKIKA